METLSQCPVCSGNSFNPFLLCKDYTVSKSTFAIVQCDACGFKFTNPRPSEKELGAYYKSEEYISHSNTKTGLVSRLYQSIRKYTLIKKLQLVFRLNKGTGKILDVGCGTGEFLTTCKNGGWETVGIEPDPDARKYGRENYKLDVKEESELKNLPEKSFDIITLWHVLEHIPNLNQRVEELKKLLKDKGTLVVAVPNSSSLDAKIYQEFWAAYDVPRHLYHFTPADIEKLFSNHGMKVSRVLPMTFDSFYVSMLSEKYKYLKINYLRAVWTGFRSNLAAIKTGRTYSSQIYIIRKK